MLKNLQYVQNAAARIITCSRKHKHITPIFTDLHWLPIEERIQFKVFLLTYKILTGMAPTYLKKWFHDTKQKGRFVLPLHTFWSNNLLNFFLTENDHSLYLHLSYRISCQLKLSVRQTLIFLNWKLKHVFFNWLYLDFLNLCCYILLYLIYQLCKLLRLTRLF